VPGRSRLRLVDTALLRRLSVDSHISGRAAQVLSQAAQWGAGWHLLTVVLALCPAPARRVGTAGAASWAVAQMLTAATKPLIGRRRPSLRATGPGVTSPSMPSTHTAAGIAYATAGMVQHRGAAALLVPAGGVAWSRVQTRRHFASDVFVGAIAGCAVGCGVGVVVRRLMNDGGRRSADPAALDRLRTPWHAAHAPATMQREATDTR